MSLELRGVRCRIGKLDILRDIDLDVADRCMVGLVGVNGSGKSTLIRTIAGLRPPAEGSVRIDGRDVFALPARRRARMMSYVGQEDTPAEDLLVHEMVAMGRIPHRPPWSFGEESERAIVRQALRHVDLTEAAQRPCDQLSGGERRRVMLARGIAQDTDLLVLDEPTNHLDVRHQINLLTTVRGLGRTVVAAMHDLSLAASFFDRIAVLHEGTILTCGEPSKALSPEIIRTVFSVPATALVDGTDGRRLLLLGSDAARPTQEGTVR